MMLTVGLLVHLFIDGGGGIQLSVAVGSVQLAVLLQSPDTVLTEILEGQLEMTGGRSSTTTNINWCVELLLQASVAV